LVANGAAFLGGGFLGLNFLVWHQRTNTKGFWRERRDSSLLSRNNNAWRYCTDDAFTTRWPHNKSPLFDTLHSTQYSQSIPHIVSHFPAAPFFFLP
jgi:hypothetical protein